MTGSEYSGSGGIRYSVVIPVYNEEMAIRPLYSMLRETMRRLGESYEIIFVDDGSIDSTSAVLKELSQREERVRAVRLESNLGQSAAFQQGFRSAGGEVIITIDGDLQNDPGDIPLLLEKMKDGYDVVCGWRRQRADSLLIRALSLVANFSRRAILKEKIHDVGCPLRVYTKESLGRVDISGGMYYMITAILLSSGCRIGEARVRHYPRRFGSSKYGVITRLSIANTFFRHLYDRKNP